MTGACELKDEKPEVKLGFVLQDIKEDGLGFRSICEVDIPSMPAWDMECEESSPSVNGNAQTDLNCAGTESRSCDRGIRR